MKTGTSKRTSNRASLIGFAVAGALGLTAGPVSAGTILGSVHDFSLQGFSGGQICVVCHTPHNSDVSVTDAPLWNHETTAVTNFTMYTSPSLDATSTGQPGGVSRLCLSCHDGTVAVDSFGGATGTNFVSPGAQLGTDLSNDHPISITYDSALATLDAGLHDPATTNVTIGAGGDKTRGPDSISNLMLSNNTVQCNSCHDVHNNFTVPGAPGFPLLKVSKSSSTLCLTCHNK